MRLFALAALLAALPAFAQPPAGDGAANAVVLTPGHPDLAFEEVDLRDQTLDVRLVRPMAHDLGTVTDVVTHHDDGTVSIETTVALSMPGGGGQQTISTGRYVWPSLAPLSHTTADLGDGDAGEIAFDGLHVSGTYSEDGATPLPFDLTLDAPTFGPGSVHVIARALPLREGYRATAATFSADDRLEEMTFVVVGPESVERADGTTVSGVAVEMRLDGRAQRYLVDPDTRDLLMMTVAPAPGATVEATPR